MIEMIIKCAICNLKVFKYQKVGKGKLWHCWKERIITDYTIRDGNEVRCRCSNLIGIEQEKWVKIKQHSVIISK